MPSNFLQDLEVVDESTVEFVGQAYPVAQWLHGDPKLASGGGVAHTGGVILPLKYLGDGAEPAPGWAKTTVAFSTGKTEAVLAAQKPRLAVIRTRFRWFIVNNGVTTFYPRPGYVAESGMRGHLQVLCAVEGYDFPIVVTFKGKASQEFERCLKDFTQTVFDAVQKVTRKNGQAPRQFPRFAFYMPIAPGAHMRAGQKGQDALITPPVLNLPAQLSDQYVQQLYVGRERLVALQQVYHEAAAWTSAWDKPSAEATAPEEHEPSEEPAW